MRKQPAVTRELLKTATELRWRNVDVLMIGGSVMSVAADGLLAAQKWLDEHPSVRMILNNLGTSAGMAMWVKNFTPVGLLIGVVVEVGYTQIMKLIEQTNAQENLSAFLLSIDDDLNKEQADVLASTAIKFVKEAGRLGIQWGASKGFNALSKKFGGQAPKELEIKDSRGMKGEKGSKNEQIKTTNAEINKSYKSPTQEELLEIWTKQETISQPLDILGNAKLFGE